MKPPRVASAKPAIEENGVAENGNTNGNSEETAKQVNLHKVLTPLVRCSQEPDPQNPESLDRRHLIKQIGPITIDSLPPDKPTQHKVRRSAKPHSVLLA